MNPCSLHFFSVQISFEPDLHTYATPSNETRKSAVYQQARTRTRERP